MKRRRELVRILKEESVFKKEGAPLFDTLYHSTHPIFETWSPLHFLVLFVVFGAAVVMMRFPRRVRTYEGPIRSALIAALFLQQFLLYSWYVFNDAFDVVDALPLYPCRITMVLTLFLLIRWNDAVFTFTLYWGLIGAVLALLFPDTNGLGFPNVMFIQFFLGHGALLIGVLFLAIVHDVRPSTIRLTAALRWTVVYFLAVVSINAWTGGNYAYLRIAPPVPLLDGAPSFPWNVPITFGVVAFLFWSLTASFTQWTKWVRLYEAKRSNGS